MRTIKDVFKKVDEMKEKDFVLRGEHGCDQCGYTGHQALEEVKPIIEKGIKEILEGLVKEKKKELYSSDSEIEEYNTYSEYRGYNQRESKLREDIEKIIN